MWVLGYIIHTHIKPFGHVHKAPDDNNIYIYSWFTLHMHTIQHWKKEKTPDFLGGASLLLDIINIP
jgi:hypothetical protein